MNKVTPFLMFNDQLELACQTSVMIRRYTPNHRAALEAGSAFCYRSCVICVARVSTGR
jgi:hypothetical protein